MNSRLRRSQFQPKTVAPWIEFQGKAIHTSVSEFPASRFSGLQRSFIPASEQNGGVGLEPERCSGQIMPRANLQKEKWSGHVSNLREHLGLL